MPSSQSISFNIGKPVDSNYRKKLASKLRKLLKTSKLFPGTKSVSFERKHLDLLETEDYFVCERGAGKRFLLLFFHTPKGPSTFLVDNHQKWYHIPNLVFTVRKNEHEYLKDTVLDGELLQHKHGWKFRVFDAMIINDDDITHRSINSRLGRAQQEVIKPFQSKYPTGLCLSSTGSRSFITIELKKMELSYGLHLVLNKISSHQSIIWTPVNQPYTKGQNNRLLLWTPPEMNRAFLRLTAKWDQDHKAVYALHVTQGPSYKFYDYFTPGYPLGLKWKDKVPFDRIGEFRYDPEWKTTIYEPGYAPILRKGGWSFVSFCDSRTVANIKETADNIQRQVVEEQEVTRSQLVSHIDKIRIAWKARKEGPPLDSPPTPPVEKSNQNVPMDALETIILDSPMSLSPSCSALVPSISEQEDADFHEQDIEPMEIEYAEPIQEEFTEPVTAPPVHVYTERYKSNSWMSKNHTTQPYLTIYQQRKKAKCIKSKLDFILN